MIHSRLLYLFLLCAMFPAGLQAQGEIKTPRLPRARFRPRRPPPPRLSRPASLLLLGCQQKRQYSPAIKTGGKARAAGSRRPIGDPDCPDCRGTGFKVVGERGGREGVRRQGQRPLGLGRCPPGQHHGVSALLPHRPHQQVLYWAEGSDDNHQPHSPISFSSWVVPAQFSAAERLLVSRNLASIRANLSPFELER